MKREIKFRGLTANDEWVYGLPSHDLPSSTAYYDEYSYRICWHPEKGGYANIPVKNATLVQYTGLKDKNGVEIYEGDIVKTEHGATGICSWNQVKARFDFDCREPMWPHPIYDMSGEKEIIGNIYENPELLEVNKDG